MINLQTKLANTLRPLVILDQKPAVYRITMIMIFLAAGAIRLYHIDRAGALVDREFTSAIFARSFYFDQTDLATEWQKDVAAISKSNQPVLEPPITEYLVSLIYRVMGREQLWVSHILTGLFWLVGGVFFFEAAKMVVSMKAAIIATIYYLFTPLSILLSRSFQPDALMMLLFLISLYGILKYYEQATLTRMLVVGGITGLAFLYRPLIFFPLIGVFISLAIHRTRSWKFFLQKDFILFIIISLLPAVLYYGYGVFIAGFLRWKIASSFRPSLYLHREYWEGWIYLAATSLGLPFLLGALVGLPTMGKGKPRFLMASLWAGYVVFGLVFTMHIHTHDYYQAQLIPAVGLSFGSLAAVFLDRIQQLNNRWYWWLPIGVAVILVLYFDLTSLRTRINSQIYESEQVAQTVGDIVNHSSRTVFVSRYYAMPLQYYGQMAGMPWLKAIETPLYRQPGERELSVDERIANYDFIPEYYVITDFNEFNNRHADLKEYLDNNCPVIAQTNRYFIYDGNCN